ncbi:hypothetical protein [Chitinophaga sp. Cy-1792]|uniref:hypothetical protein n=1 Tax=Chitinophaga sp. Cy-1792 TaxID=2608339 RepID=UPI00142372E8|nr:hypothetical protein [Chitinophaga sp. Cy-1792]NIG57031.1 hypothetical protein [Chitinophaga sp. Cy-1792]
MRHLLLLICLTVSIAATAQDSSDVKNLNLSPAQTSRLKEINKTFIKDAQLIRQDKTLSDADKKTKLQSLSYAREDKIKTVLTPDQVSKWQQQHLAMHQMADMHKKDTQKVTAHIKDQLNLTDDQAKRFKVINKEYKTQLKAVRQDNTLSRQEKTQKQDSLKTAEDTQIKGLLSDDQYSKYQELKIEMQERMRELKRTQNRDLPGKNAPGKS